MTATQDRIKAIIIERLGVDADKVTPDARFIEDLGADSLDFVDLIMTLEEEFQIPIEDDEAEKILTVGQAIAFVEERVS